MKNNVENSRQINQCVVVNLIQQWASLYNAFSQLVQAYEIEQKIIQKPV